ncbi:MAG: hypothetical protein E6479_00265, partial [Neisseria mucosa]|nr:hypothetical protein [Neisseria mucosa]
NVVFKTHTDSAKSKQLKNKQPILESNLYFHTHFESAAYHVHHSSRFIKPSIKYPINKNAV